MNNNEARLRLAHTTCTPIQRFSNHNDMRAYTSRVHLFVPKGHESNSLNGRPRHERAARRVRTASPAPSLCLKRFVILFVNPHRAHELGSMRWNECAFVKDGRERITASSLVCLYPLHILTIGDADDALDFKGLKFDLNNRCFARWLKRLFTFSLKAGRQVEHSERTNICMLPT